MSDGESVRRGIPVKYLRVLLNFDINDICSPHKACHCEDYENV